MYWYLLGKDLNCDQFINESRPGSSNDLIIQRVMRHVLENPNLDVFYIINLTTLNRLELEKNTSDKMEHVLKPEALVRLDHEIVECTAYAQIIGVVSLLKQYNKDFYIINNAKCYCDGSWSYRDNYMNFVLNEPRILNLYKWSKFNFHKDVSKIKPYDFHLYGWFGHDGPEGNYAYYKKLKEIIDERKIKV